MHCTAIARRVFVTLALAMIPLPALAVDTLVEFYNTVLGHYFITIDPNEATAIDTGAAGAGWQRTGKTFGAYIQQSAAPAGAVAVCRFYGDVAKGGPNGHFYTADAAECAAVKQDPGWTFERVEFYVRPVPAGGTCPAGTDPVYRNYNKRFAERDSNHRYTTDLATYNAMIAQGWSGEGVVFCAASTTTPVPNDNSDCSILYVNGKTLQYDVTSTANGSTTTSTSTRVFGPDTTFNGQPAMQVIDTSSSGSTAIQFIQDTPTEWISLGNRAVSGGTTVNLVNQPPVRNAKSWTIGQSRTYAFSVVGGPSGTGTVNGTQTLSRRESITTPGGTFNACVFRFDQTTTYPVGSTSRTVSDIWVAASVGVVRHVTNDTTSVAGFSITSSSTSTLNQVQ